MAPSGPSILGLSDAPRAASKQAATRAGSAKTNGKAAAKKTTMKPQKSKAKAHNAEPDRSSPAMAEVDADVLEFIAAIDAFKQANGRPFPSWSEVLLVIRELGYRRP